MAELILLCRVMIRSDIVALVGMDRLGEVGFGEHRIYHTGLWHRFDGRCRRQRSRDSLGLLLKLRSIVLLDHGRLLSHHSRHLRLLFKIVLVVPTPFLDQVINDELYAPASLLMDLSDNGQNFFLLVSSNEAFASVMDRTKSYAGNTTVLTLVIYLVPKVDCTLTDL